MSTTTGETAAAAPRLGSISRNTWLWAGLIVLGLLVLILAPTYLLLESEQRTLSSVFMFVVLAQGWNLIGGFAGYPSFGNVVFFGLGGYTTAVLMAKAGVNFWLTVPAAAAVGLGFAILMGIPILRLKGHYFAIATLGVAEGMREVVINTGGLTGGNKGITVPAVGAEATTSYPGNTGFYFYFLALALISVAVVWAVSRSRFGYALRAISQDEDAAAAAGINTTRAKIAAFALAGTLTAVAGALFAFQTVSVYPERMFDVDITVLMVIMAVLGGAGTVVGPVIGAVSLQYLSEWLRDHLTDYHTFVFGGIIVLAVLVVPMGVVNFTREAWARRRIALFEAVRQYRL